MLGRTLPQQWVSATTSHEQLRRISRENWWVASGTPIIIVSTRDTQLLCAPKQAKDWDIQSEIDARGIAIDHVEWLGTTREAIAPEKAGRAVKLATDRGHAAPAVYTNGERDYERLLERDDIDFVYIATPWEWHTPMALAAMRSGHDGGPPHVGT